jgi:N-formylglutamate amidohydrolase
MREHQNICFSVLEAKAQSTPVVLSVPHAGRDYPAGLEALITCPVDRLIGLEDRLADVLIEKAVANGTCGLVARTPRLIIDLNRHELDVDPALFDGPIAHQHRLSAKVRGGLGLIPRRTAELGDIWRQKLAAEELERRINQVHRPYHAMLSQKLSQAHAAFGIAVLLDVHSMPPLPATGQERAPDIVIGDLFGRSAFDAITRIAADTVRAHGLHVAINAPYPGNYVLERQCAPSKGIHGLQIEVDRRLYLNDDQRTISPKAAQMQDLIYAIAEEIKTYACGKHFAIAAE